MAVWSARQAAGAGRAVRPRGSGGRLHSLAAALVGPSVVHRRLQVVGGLEFHVHPYVVRETADEELRALLTRHARGVAREGLEAIGEVLHRGCEGKAPKLREAAPANWRPEAKEA